MAMKQAFLASSLAATVGVVIIGVAVAQDMGSGMMRGGRGSGMMERQTTQSTPRTSSTQGPMCSSGSCPCMGDGASDLMHQDMMHGGMGGGMMNQSMMRGGAGHGMMMRGDAGSGMGTLFGSHVVPTLNLSEDDVRGFLIARLDRLNNKRLKLGEVKADDSTITADVVTVDNSLVQRLKVYRHTGDIEYEN